MSTDKRKSKPSEDSDIILKTHGAITNVFVKFFRAIQTQIIVVWMPKFEQKYISTFKKLDENQSDAKTIRDIIFNRMEKHNFKEPLTIILKYTPAEKFTVLSTYTAEEIEYEEFQKWKKKRK